MCSLYKGYMPIVGHLAENGLAVAHEFREGNVSPNSRNLEFYEQCKKAMPAGKRLTALRADSAGYQGKLLDPRGEHSENRINELKLDFGMERMPCGQFAANALFFAVGVLAYNLYKLFVQTVLPDSWRNLRASSLRYRFYAVAGKVVHTGGRLLLRVNRLAHEMFSRVRGAVARMGCG